jgi:predicted kinase
MPPPVLVLLKGQPGSGKSALAEQLASRLGWELIVRDDFKATLAATGTATELVGPTSYRMMWSRALDVLTSGKSCICDANLNQPVALVEIERVVGQTGARPVFIECVCSDVDEHRRRLDGRTGLGLPVGWIDSWDKFQQYLRSDDNQGTYRVPYPLARVDTAVPVDLDALQEWVAGAGINSTLLLRRSSRGSTERTGGPV